MSSGAIPVLKVDADTNRYYQVTDFGDRLIEPYGEDD